MFQPQGEQGDEGQPGGDHEVDQVQRFGGHGDAIAGRGFGFLEGVGVLVGHVWSLP